MKHTITLILTILTFFVIANTAWAQGGAISVYYCPVVGDEPPLGCGCDPNGRVPFPEGTPVCVFWDNNHNGPDEADVIVPLGNEPGQCSQNCWPVGCGGPGYFFTDPLFALTNLPQTPDTALYYFRVSGTTCCWESRVFSVATGLNPDVFFTEADWTCGNEPCCVGFEIPTPVSNVQASDDQFCLAVDVTWEHSGQNVTGFSIFVNGESRVFTSADQRHATVDLCMDGETQIGVQTINGCETADIVSNTGSTYLRRFLPGIGGTYTGGSDIEIHLSRPPTDGYCAAYLWFDLFSNDTHVARLCSLVDAAQPVVLDLTCQLPIQDLTNCFIVLSDTNPTNSCGTSDTTETFNITVDAETDPGVVREFSLAQNYPNPFNPETRIEFTTPSNADVTLSVYDLNGRLVNTLVSSSMPAGKHFATWNGRSASGSAVAAGLYFYQLRAGNQVETKKMLFLK